MNLIGVDSNIYDYIMDSFKGICELNNYLFVKGSINEIEYKYFTYDDEHLEIGFIGKITPYRITEILNIGVKYFEIMDIDNIKVKISNKSVEELLDSIEIEHIDTKDSIELITEDKRLDKTVSLGTLETNNDKVKLILEYKTIKDVVKEIKGNVLKSPIDVYIVPKDENAYEDALVISTMLTDAGYKVEADYKEIDYKEKFSTAKNSNASYIMTISDGYSRSYQVKMLDNKTGVEKMVDINNLVEELDINF